MKEGAELYKFFSAGRKKNYTAGEIVVNGEEPSGVVYLDKGFVKVYSISDKGDEYVHIIYKDGEIFPLVWAMKKIRRRVFYEALSDVSVWTVTREDFLNLIGGNLKAANEVNNRLAESFYVYADRLDNLEYKSTSERIIHRLLFLAGRFGERSGKTIIINAPLTHELIASSIRLSRETVSREMEKLTEQKVIARHNGLIVIRDLDGLAGKISTPVTFNLWGLS
jgi:CRP-like cAMP-binding protein